MLHAFRNVFGIRERAAPIRRVQVDARHPLALPVRPLNRVEALVGFMLEAAYLVDKNLNV